MNENDEILSNMSIGDKRLTWREKCEHLEAENRRLQGFATIVADLSRNRSGRHEGDSDFNDPTGISQGNPHLAVGQVFGYGIHGYTAYARPARHEEGDPGAWQIKPEPVSL